MATTKDTKRTEAGRVSYRGESFSGFNKPKRTSGGNKKFAVLARQGDQVKLVRFGDPNMTIKKPYQNEEPVFVLAISAQRRRTNSRLDTGLARHGDINGRTN